MKSNILECWIREGSSIFQPLWTFKKAKLVHVPDQSQLKISTKNKNYILDLENITAKTKNISFGVDSLFIYTNNDSYTIKLSNPWLQSSAETTYRPLAIKIVDLINNPENLSASLDQLNNELRIARNSVKSETKYIIFGVLAYILVSAVILIIIFSIFFSN